MTETGARHCGSGTKGRVLHAAAAYDLLVWLFLLGRERAFRERLVQLARVQPAQSVLDIGCGTGSLAVMAGRRVGASGSVDGIDPSPEMIARARKKAMKAGVDVTFTQGVVENLPFPDQRFDVVLSTLMLHHLPAAGRAQCVREISRVLKPGGRVLAVDFGKASGRGKSWMKHFHRHGHVAAADIVALLSAAGFNSIESGPMGVRDMYFVLARA
ncbi:MAG: methyltransferase domain-containing protein [Gemmatimonadota bacterium]|nr:methyltransferase domain-containing protein [Gemmatimonadota bacterium]